VVSAEALAARFEEHRPHLRAVSYRMLGSLSDADDVRAIAGSVVVFGHVTGRAGGERVVRRVVWTWLLRDGKAISVRADDLGAGT
jgi:ketosteroid isomerase-like protein